MKNNSSDKSIKARRKTQAQSAAPGNNPSSVDYGALTAAALNEHFTSPEHLTERKAYLLGLESRSAAEQLELEDILAHENSTLA